METRLHSSEGPGMRLLSSERPGMRLHCSDGPGMRLLRISKDLHRASCRRQRWHVSRRPSYPLPHPSLWKAPGRGRPLRPGTPHAWQEKNFHKYPPGFHTAEVGCGVKPPSPSPPPQENLRLLLGAQKKLATNEYQKAWGRGDLFRMNSVFFYADGSVYMSISLQDSVLSIGIPFPWEVAIATFVFQLGIQTIQVHLQGII